MNGASQEQLRQIFARMEKMVPAELNRYESTERRVTLTDSSEVMFRVGPTIVAPDFRLDLSSLSLRGPLEGLVSARVWRLQKEDRAEFKAVGYSPQKKGSSDLASGQAEALLSLLPENAS